MSIRSIPLLNFGRYKTVFNEEFQVYLKAGDKKSLVRQAYELLDLYKVYGYLPYQYLVHNLYLRRFGKDIYRYMPTDLLHRTRDTLNAGTDLAVVEDKVLFEQTIRAAGLPTTRSLYRASRETIADMAGNGVTYDGFVAALCESNLADGIIAKPLSGGSGKAVFKFTCANGALRHQGETLDRERFLDLIFTTNDGGYWSEFLVQEVIVQHPEISRFNATSVNTIRIDTFIDDAGAVHFNAAALKVGAPGSITDNAATGGYLISIDIDTGRLRSGAMRIARYGGQYHDVGRVFGIDPATFAVPFWPEVRRVMAEAARALAPLRSLGWDVAITPDGPLVVETNADYGIYVLQELSGGYVDKPLGRACLDRHPARKARVLRAVRPAARDDDALGNRQEA